MSHDTSTHLRPEIQDAFAQGLMAAAQAKQAGASRTQQDQAGQRAAQSTMTKAFARKVASVLLIVIVALVIIITIAVR